MFRGRLERHSCECKQMNARIETIPPICPLGGIYRGDLKSVFIVSITFFLFLTFQSCGPDIIEDGVPHRTFQTWQHYLGDPARTHYSTLSEINTENVTKLQPIWRYESGGLRMGQTTQIQTNPLIVGDILYGVNPKLRLFALNAASGELLWEFDPPRKDGSGLGVNRGLAYWAGSNADTSRLFISSGPFLYAVDAGNGQLITTFGKKGKIDLREGLGRDPKRLTVVSNTPGAIYKNLYIMGTRVGESPGAAPGHIRAYDVLSGEIVWTFYTIPQPGEFGYDTWPPEAFKYIGGANNWAGMALDHKYGMVFVPTGSAAFDFYGGNRRGDNLFANTLLALDARDGKLIWHYQIVRHDLWDRDLPAPPNLVTVKHDGSWTPAVAQITKSGHVFLFHRMGGFPLFPVKEMQVPASKLPGEAASPTQPLPLKPAPFSRQFLSEDMLYQPDSQAYVADFVDQEINNTGLTVRERFRQVTSAGQFVPTDTTGVVMFPGFDGGAEWGGAAVDPTAGILYVNANEMPWIVRMGRVAGSSTTPGEAVYQLHCARCHGGILQGIGENPDLRDVRRLSRKEIADVTRNGRGAMPPNAQLSDEELRMVVDFLSGEHGGNYGTFVSADVPYSVAGFGRFLDRNRNPVVKPPWGTLTAIDLSSGEHLWQVPLGNIETVNDPEFPVTGAENYGGPVVTAGGLIFIAATKDEKLRAFSSKTGEQLWEYDLPAGGYATPATYEVDGRQYLVIACGGGKMGTPSGDVYLAFALKHD